MKRHRTRKRRKSGTTPARAALSCPFLMYHRQSLPVAVGDPDDEFFLYHKIPSVVLIYGNGPRLHADEHAHAGRLMRSLDWIGREGVPLRGVLTSTKTLDRSSLRALGLYLTHGNGLTAFRRVSRQSHPFHKHGWRELQELLSLRWV
jgi:hypothetical protein